MPASQPSLLCPFRKLPIPDPQACAKIGVCGLEFIGDFLPCLQAKCAMWHPSEHIVVPESPPAHEYDIPGHCGLAGRP